MVSTMLPPQRTCATADGKEKQKADFNEHSGQANDNVKLAKGHSETKGLGAPRAQVTERGKDGCRCEDGRRER